MKKAYLNCMKKEGDNRVDVYDVIIPLSNGKRSSGTISKRFFNKNGQLKVSIVEENGEKTTVILPERIYEGDSLTVKSCLITN